MRLRYILVINVTYCSLSLSLQLADDNYVSLEKAHHPGAQRDGQREGIESPRHNYQNLKEFLGEDDNADDTYYNMADLDQAYQNVPTHILDDYAAFEAVRKSAEEPAEATMRERKVSQDNQYIYVKSHNKSAADVTADVTVNDMVRARVRHLSEPTKKPVKYANLEYPLPPVGGEETYTAVFGEEAKEPSAEGRRKEVIEFPVRREEGRKDQVVQNGRASGGVDEGEEGGEHLYVNVKRPEEEEEVMYQNITKTL